MSYDFKRWGLFFVLLAVIYFIANLLFSAYVFANEKRFVLSLLLDKKVLIFFAVGVALNWQELKYMKFNILAFIKDSVFSTYQSIPFLIFISLIFVLPNLGQMNKYQMIYEAFQLVTSLAIWQSCRR